MLGTVGGGDQRLRTSIQLDDIVVVEDLAQPRPDRRAARLRVSTAPSDSASSAAWVLLPLPSAPSKAM